MAGKYFVHHQHFLAVYCAWCPCLVCGINFFTLPVYLSRQGLGYSKRVDSRNLIIIFLASLDLICLLFCVTSTKATETDCQIFEGNSQVLSEHLFAIQHVSPSLTSYVHSDGSCISLPFEHLQFPLEVHEAKVFGKLTGARKVNELLS